MNLPDKTSFKRLLTIAAIAGAGAAAGTLAVEALRGTNPGHAFALALFAGVTVGAGAFIVAGLYETGLLKVQE